VYSPMEVRQPKGREVVDLAKGHGIEAHQGDGNDAAEVYALTAKAVEKAREGGGPSFLEFKTYRWREHCGPMFDNDIGYRTPAEYEAWKVRCPVRRSEEKLLAAKAATRAELDGWAKAYLAEMNEAVAFAKASPWPDPGTLLEGVTA
jgi:TPP-dependent pyruvate/acetoin dehydrogenase alpha subunit